MESCARPRETEAAQLLPSRAATGDRGAGRKRRALGLALHGLITTWGSVSVGQRAPLGHGTMVFAVMIVVAVVCAAIAGPHLIGRVPFE